MKPEAEEGGEGGGAEGGAAPKPGAKKRGRPPKTAYMAGAGAVPNFPPNAATFNAGGGGPAHGTVLGSRVEGVVDGSFDLGYFLTVRIAGTNQASTRHASRIGVALLTSCDSLLPLPAAHARHHLPPGALRRRPGAKLCCNALRLACFDALRCADTPPLLLALAGGARACRCCARCAAGRWRRDDVRLPACATINVDDCLQRSKVLAPQLIICSA